MGGGELLRSRLAGRAAFATISPTMSFPAVAQLWRRARFELVINLRTAEALGLTIPQALLQRADEVVQ